jgi:outer membrane protein
MIRTPNEGRRRAVLLLTPLTVAIAVLCPEGTRAQSLPLAAAIDSAFATHPALARAEARETSAAEAAATTRGRRWPSLSLRSGLTHFKEPMLATPIHAFDPTLLPEFNETLWQSQLFANYTLIDWGSRGGSIEAAEAQQRVAQAGSRAARAEVIGRVSEAYLRVLSARAVDEAARARVAALAEERGRAQRGLDAGTAAEVELLRAAVALQDAEAARTTTSGAVLLAERTLARVIGTTPERVASATLPEVRTLRLGAPDPAEDIDNPVVIQARARGEAARALADTERGPRWPRLDLTAGINQFGTLDLAPIFEWQAGIALSWEIFSGGSRAASVRRAEADLRVAESDLAAVRLDVATAVDAGRTSITSADARVDALAASVEQWEELVRIERLALGAGAGTQRDLLDAESGLYQARAGLVEAHAEAFLARIRLAEAEGRLDREWIMEMSGGS